MQAHAEAPPVWFDTQYSRRNTAQHDGHWLTYFASSSREASFRVWSRMVEWVCISVSSFRVPHPSVAVSSNVCHRASLIGTHDPDDTPLTTATGYIQACNRPPVSSLWASWVDKVNAGHCRTVHYVIPAPLLLPSKTLPTWSTDRKHRA